MLERISDVLRNRKDGDKGFSLVELAVVIVIIGILVAIAVPIFANMQAGARKANIQAAAANGSAIVASNLASGEDAADGLSDLVSGDVTNVAVVGDTLDDYCVTATGSEGTSEKGSTPGCNGNSWDAGGEEGDG